MADEPIVVRDCTFGEWRPKWNVTLSFEEASQKTGIPKYSLLQYARKPKSHPLHLKTTGRPPKKRIRETTLFEFATTKWEQ